MLREPLGSCLQSPTESRLSSYGKVAWKSTEKFKIHAIANLLNRWRISRVLARGWSWR